MRELARFLSESSAVDQLWVEERGYRDALKLMLDRRDQRWSFVDCTSFVMMKELGIPVAFTFDDDFRQAGFRTLP